jgi:hypothetical protein
MQNGRCRVGSIAVQLTCHIVPRFQLSIVGSFS